MILIGFIFSVIDAAGKPPADVLGGDINWLGDYEECLAIHSNLTFNSSVTLNPIPAFHGEYCLVGIPLNAPANPVSKCEEIHDLKTNIHIFFIYCDLQAKLLSLEMKIPQG